MNKQLSPARLFRAAAILTVITIFFTLTFEAFHAGHEADCHEEDCPVCLVLQIIHSTRKLPQAAVPVLAEFINYYYIRILILSALLLAPATLVRQKVKLVI